MKKLKLASLAVCLMALGMLIVSAATSTIYTNTSYTLAKGGAVAAINLSASYDYAKASTEVDSVTSGTKTTRFVGSLRTNGSYVEKTTGSGSIAAYTCNLISIGKIGKGTWQIVNYATDGTGNNYAGWSGKISYVASTTI